MNVAATIIFVWMQEEAKKEEPAPPAEEKKAEEKKAEEAKPEEKKEEAPAPAAEEKKPEEAKPDPPPPPAEEKPPPPPTLEELYPVTFVLGPDYTRYYYYWGKIRAKRYQCLTFACFSIKACIHNWVLNLYGSKLVL